MESELRECIQDNTLLTQHVTRQKANEPFTEELQQRNVQLSKEIYLLREDQKVLVEEKAGL